MYLFVSVLPQHNFTATQTIINSQRWQLGETENAGYTTARVVNFTSVFPLSLRISFLIQKEIRPPVDLLNVKFTSKKFHIRVLRLDLVLTSNQHSTSCLFQIKQKIVVVIKSERTGKQSAEPNHADIKHPRRSASWEILRHAQSFVYVCV